MSTVHTFSIDFIKRNCKEEKDMALLYARVTVDGQPTEISLKEKISASDWDNNREGVKGKTIRVKQLNQYGSIRHILIHSPWYVKLSHLLEF